MRSIAAAILLGVLLTASRARATAQYPDKIFYEGKERELLSNPLEPFFKKHPGKRPKVTHASTALWRGYVATFEFADKRMVLKDIKVEAEPDGDGEPWKSVKGDLMPEGQTMAIDWFNGILVIPNGTLIWRQPWGYNKRYSAYILLEVREGKLTRQRKFDQKGYEQFLERQFQAFKKTDQYKELFAKWANSGESKESVDEIIRNSIVYYTDRFMDEEG